MTGPLTVFADVPDAFAPRAEWALGTMLAPLGRRAALTRDPAASGGAALAYAPAPVAGVPTIPCSSAAMDVFAAGRPLPARAFAPREGAGGAAAGAFAAPCAGFAVPFDLVASAFALLACWDEHTSTARDRFDRLPYAASVFAANPALRIEEPAVDGYVALLRAHLRRGSPSWGSSRCPHPAGCGPGGAAATASQPMDIRAPASPSPSPMIWTTSGAGRPRASGRGPHRGPRPAPRRPLRRRTRARRCARLAHVLPPARRRPILDLPADARRRGRARRRSTFFVIPRHTARVDGSQPETYARRIPAVLELLRRARREIGVHGNDADRLDAGAVAADRDDLARRAGSPVAGIRYHYLRCRYHETLPLLERAGFDYDTSLAFAEHEGFRCGASFPFAPYCLAQERPLRLLELPLVLMDTSLQGERYRALDAAGAEGAGSEVLARVAAGGGGAAVLWHNVRFDHRAAHGYDDVYWRLVDEVLAGGGYVAPAADVVRRWRARTREAA